MVERKPSIESKPEQISNALDKQQGKRKKRFPAWITSLVGNTIFLGGFSTSIAGIIDSSQIAVDGGLIMMAIGFPFIIAAEIQGSREARRLQKSITLSQELKSSPDIHFIDRGTELRKRRIRNRLADFGNGVFYAGAGNWLGGFIAGASDVINGGLITMGAGTALIVSRDIQRKMEVNRLLNNTTALSK